MDKVDYSRVVLDTTKVQIFKQITTEYWAFSFLFLLFQIPQRYRFSSKSQLNSVPLSYIFVVLDTTKVQIFKQITTITDDPTFHYLLFQIPQRYRFSSKSQLLDYPFVVYHLLFQIPQRYRFSSKSQLNEELGYDDTSCFRYHKGTDFQANHNNTVRI